MTKEKEGKIEQINSNGDVFFEDGSSIYVEPGFGFRQLHEVLGDPIGKTIKYETDSTGLMMSNFEPVEEN